MSLLRRKVRIIHPKPDKGQIGNIPFEEVLSAYPNVVLLGDPGAGKTTLFEFGCTNENGIFFHARAFPIYADNSVSDGIVFIDALDEKRSRGETVDSISGIIAKLVTLKPKKVRISCRSLDWLGETDLALFKPYFESSGGFSVAALEQLSEVEQLQMLSDLGEDNPKTFLK